MRKPKGKLVALLAGAVVVVLVAVVAMFWKDVCCHLFLDPRLAGQWTSQAREVRIVIKFDRIGNMRTNLVAPPEIRLRIDGGPVASSHLPAGVPNGGGAFARLLGTMLAWPKHVESMDVISQVIYHPCPALATKVPLSCQGVTDGHEQPDSTDYVGVSSLRNLVRARGRRLGDVLGGEERGASCV